tara:strand:- start:1728 stop:4007 length:2280 start_codon:yes stop_codon:yes gene_type:complete
MSCVNNLEEIPQTDLEFEADGNTLIASGEFAEARDILNNKCLSCHTGQISFWGVDPSATEQEWIDNTPANLIQPGAPFESNLVKKMIHFPGGNMPINDTLSRAEYETIVSWIASLNQNTAPNPTPTPTPPVNPNPPTPPVQLTVFEQAQNVLNDKCLSCHTGQVSDWNIGPDSTESDWINNTPSDLIKPGYSDQSLLVTKMIHYPGGNMPTNGNLSLAEFDYIDAWVEGLTPVTQPTPPSPTPTPPPTPTPNPPAPPSFNTADLALDEAFGESGLKRLSKLQYQKTVEDIFKLQLGNLVDEIPADPNSNTYFDRDSNQLSVTDTQVEGYYNLAVKISELITSNKVSSLIQCNISSDSNNTCIDKYLSEIGKLVLRREVTPLEVTNYKNAFDSFKTNSSDNLMIAKLATTTMLSHPEFLYQTEAKNKAINANGLAALSVEEIASRLSFFLWNQAPTRELWEKVAQYDLTKASGRDMVITYMLEDQKAQESLVHFHAQWLGFGQLALNQNLESDMLLESETLIKEINFNNPQDWLNIYSYSKTFLTPELSSFYQLGNVSGSATWVDYPAGRGAGVLAHAGFAGHGKKFGDTSPTLRGYEVYKRVLCGSFDQSIPAIVDINMPPGSANNCKEDNYSMKDNPSCMGCHEITDNIGFGLENISGDGQYRTTEPGSSTCQISGDGALMGESFNGVTELGKILSENVAASGCATQRLFEYFTGRNIQAEDEKTLEALHGTYFEEKTLQGIIKKMLSSPGIKYRKVQ